jgi:polyhydroxyalkanoate synthesis regulator protein
MLDQTIRLGMKYLEDRMTTRIKSLEERVERQEAMIQRLLGMLEETQKKEVAKKCRRCWRTGHNVGECYAKFHLDGHELDD